MDSNLLSELYIRIDNILDRERLIFRVGLRYTVAKTPLNSKPNKCLLYYSE